MDTCLQALFHVPRGVLLTNFLISSINLILFNFKHLFDNLIMPKSTVQGDIVGYCPCCSFPLGTGMLKLLSNVLIILILAKIKNNGPWQNAPFRSIPPTTLKSFWHYSQCLFQSSYYMFNTPCHLSNYPNLAHDYDQILLQKIIAIANVLLI